MIRYWGPIPLAWRGPKDGAEHLGAESVPHRRGRKRHVDRFLKAVENDDSADRDNSRRNASGDEDAHGRNPLIGAMHLDNAAEPNPAARLANRNPGRNM